MPSVPVIPTTVSSCDGSPYHHAAAAGQGRPGRVHDELRGGHLGEWPLDDQGRRPVARPRPPRSRGRRRARRARPRTALPSATVRESWVTAVIGDIGERARCRRAGRRGASRAAVPRRSRRATRSPSGVAAGAAPRHRADALIGARAGRRARPARPASVAPGPDDPLVRAGHLDPLGPERALVLVQAEHRVAVHRLAVVRRDVDPTQVHLGAAFAHRQLDRPPAKQVHQARVIARARPCGRPSGRSSGAPRGDTGSARRSPSRRASFTSR